MMVAFLKKIDFVHPKILIKIHRINSEFIKVELHKRVFWKFSYKHFYTFIDEESIVFTKVFKTLYSISPIDTIKIKFEIY